LQEITSALLSPTWPHLHITRLQPPFFSTGLLHLGQGLVLAASQLRVSLSPLIFSSHMAHIAQVQGECGCLAHLKQKDTPHGHSGSTYGSLSTCMYVTVE
jgi:hypothetical protein